MLHVHILFVAPLCAGNVPEAGTDKHQRRVAVRKTTDDPCTSADLPVQPFDDVVRPNPRPVLRWKVAVSQCLINALRPSYDEDRCRPHTHTDICRLAEDDCAIPRYEHTLFYLTH